MNREVTACSIKEYSTYNLSMIYFVFRLEKSNLINAIR